MSSLRQHCDTRSRHLNRSTQPPASPFPSIGSSQTIRAGLLLGVRARSICPDDCHGHGWVCANGAGRVGGILRRPPKRLGLLQVPDPYPSSVCPARVFPGNETRVVPQIIGRRVDPILLCWARHALRRHGGGRSHLLSIRLRTEWPPTRNLPGEALHNGDQLVVCGAGRIAQFRSRVLLCKPA
jgi:hypothetical protein